MKDSHRAAGFLLLLLALLATPVGAIEARAPHEGEVAGAALELPSVGTLQITSEDGVCYLDLSAGADGPIRMPLEKEGFPAVLISTRHAGGRLIVTLAYEKAELETEPIGQYELSPGDKGGPGASTQAALPKLKSGRSASWDLRLVGPAEKAMPGCCGCSVAKVQCCPSAGKCLSCGTCGQCCY